MFVGKEQDQETGLYYFGARYMEAMIGRFVSPDPVGPVDPSGKINVKNILNPQRLNAFTYALNNPYTFTDPDGRDTTIIITRDRYLFFRIGSHSAVRIDNPSGGGPALYDPAGGAYNPKDEAGGPLRGSGDTFYGKDADLNKYQAAHEATGSTVETYSFATTPDQEKEIAGRIEKSGGQSPPYCASAVSEAIKGIGPFKDLKTYMLPGSLAEKLREIKHKFEKGKTKKE